MEYSISNINFTNHTTDWLYQIYAGAKNEYELKLYINSVSNVNLGYLQKIHTGLDVRIFDGYCGKLVLEHEFSDYIVFPTTLFAGEYNNFTIYATDPPGFYSTAFKEATVFATLYLQKIERIGMMKNLCPSNSSGITLTEMKHTNSNFVDPFILSKFGDKTINPMVSQYLFAMDDLYKYGLRVAGVCRSGPENDRICCMLEQFHPSSGTTLETNVFQEIIRVHFKEAGILHIDPTIFDFILMGKVDTQLQSIN